MTSSVRWGIISTALIGQEELLPAFKEAANAEVVAIASSNSQVTKIAAKFMIPKIYNTYDELLDDQDIDAVYIPLPNALHAHWVKKAAEKGKHVLCEKPAALNEKEANEMIEACKKNGVLFLEGFMYQFHPQHERVKKIIASGEIGDVKMVKVSNRFYLHNQEGNIRLNQELGGGSMYDVGCYCTHTILNILEKEPNKVFVSQGNKNDAVDMSVTGIMHFDNGITALFDAAMDSASNRCYEIFGTKGSIRVPNAFLPHLNKGEATIFINTDEGHTRDEKIVGHQYILQIDYFSSCVKKGDMSIELVNKTLKNLKIMDACFESLKNERFVDLNLS